MPFAAFLKDIAVHKLNLLLTEGIGFSKSYSFFRELTSLLQGKEAKRQIQLRTSYITH